MAAKVKLQTVGKDRYRMNIRDHSIHAVATVGDAAFGVTPAELLASAVASSLASRTAAFLRTQGVDATDLEASCDLEISEDAPLRIRTIVVRVELPAGVPDALAQRCANEIDLALVPAAFVEPPKVLIGVRPKPPAEAVPLRLAG